MEGFVIVNPSGPYYLVETSRSRGSQGGIASIWTEEPHRALVFEKAEDAQEVCFREGIDDYVEVHATPTAVRGIRASSRRSRGRRLQGAGNALGTGPLGVGGAMTTRYWIEKRPEGLYVLGRGFLCPVGSQEEGLAMIADLTGDDEPSAVTGRSEAESKRAAELFARFEE